MVMWQDVFQTHKVLEEYIRLKKEMWNIYEKMNR